MSTPAETAPAKPALKLWPITVTNPQTKETIDFLGQGTTVLEAVTDGAKNCGEKFMPSQSGVARPPGSLNGPTRLACKNAAGVITWRSLREFESGGAS